mgnify:CR=1 FL=1
MARDEFEIADLELTIEEIKRLIENEQKEKRERSFPLLEVLRPSKIIDQQLTELFSGKSMNIIAESVNKVFPALLNNGGGGNRNRLPK